MTQVSVTACAKVEPEAERRICPNGLPKIPGLGGSNRKTQRSGWCQDPGLYTICKRLGLSPQKQFQTLLRFAIYVNRWGFPVV